MAKYKPRQIRCLYVIVSLSVVAVIGVCVGVFLPLGCSDGTFTHAAVAADSQRCSEIGRDILQQGGSAVDGAIAALLCTGLVNPQSMGLGGGSIFTIMDKTGKVKVFNSRETVPQTFKADMLEDCPSTLQLITGSQWIGVPGELRGYQQVHKRYGRLPWASLFQPTIRLARDGFPMTAYLGHLLSIPMIANPMKASPLCEVFCRENRTVLKTGDTLKFPKLAETMETVAEQGADAFYTGSIGRDLIHDIKASGGTLTMEDLRLFKVREEDAWTIPLGEYQMHIPSPPAGGALLAFILNIMKGFHLTPRSMDGAGKALFYQRYIEAAKFANGQRRSIHDPTFGTAGNASYLLSADFAAHVRAKITQSGTHDDSYYNVTPSSDRYGTTHVSVLGEDGSAVSVTSTINHMFGSLVYSPRTGIILNNELADFCGRADGFRMGERPPSSMAPAILRSQSGDRTLVIGGSGGSMITTAMALSIMNHVWLHMGLKEAIAAPIVFVTSKNKVQIEPGFDESVSEVLRRNGQTVEYCRFCFNVVNAVAKEKGCISAVSDARKMGQAAGF